jgi:hypothetical protein
VFKGDLADHAVVDARGRQALPRNGDTRFGDLGGSPRLLNVTATEPTDGNVSTMLPGTVGGRQIIVRGKAKRSGFYLANVVVSVLDGQYKSLGCNVVSEVRSEDMVAFEQVINVQPGAQTYQLLLQVQGTGSASISDLSVQFVEGQAPSAASGDQPA